MDSLRTWIAVGPLAAYLVLLGIVNLRSAPTMVRGATEKIGIALALAGFVFVGPVQLFMPEEAAASLGAWVWLPLVTLYILGVTLWILTGRERLVIYNLSQRRLAELLDGQVTSQHHAAAVEGTLWNASESDLPLIVEEFAWLRCTSIIVVGRPDSAQWNRLVQTVRSRIRGASGAPNPRAMVLISVAVALVAVALLRASHDETPLTRGWHDLLRLDEVRPDAAK